MSDDLFGDDLFDDDDTFDDSFDDDLGGEDPSARVAEFESEVERQMKILLTRRRDESERIEAAYWLGNSGVPKAIAALRKIYRGEKNVKIKSAAEYALGQFKALDEAIERDPGQSVLDALGEEKNAHIVDLLQNIALKDKATSKPPRSGGWMMRLSGLLVISLAVLIALNLMTTTSSDDPTNIESFAAKVEAYRDDSDVVVADETGFDLLVDMSESLDDLRRASAVISNEFNNIETLNITTCPLAVPMPDSTNFPPEVQSTYFEIADIATDYDITVRNLMIAEDIHTRACEEERDPNADEISRVRETLASIDTDADAIEAQILEQIVFVVATITPPPEVVEPEETEMPETTVEVIPTATTVANPTLDPATERGYVRDLLGIISQVNARDGANTLLLQYWQDVEASGRTDGCNENQPSIPVLDNVPQDVIDAQNVQLQNAWVQLKDGLALLQNGWNLFRDACDAGEQLGTRLSIGLPAAQNASDLITVANQTLISIGQR